MKEETVIQTLTASKSEILAHNPPHKVRRWLTKKLEAGNVITVLEDDVNIVVKYLGDKQFQLTQIAPVM